MISLKLPSRPVPDRVSVVRVLEPFSKETYAELDGPGCIRHIWLTVTRRDEVHRKIIIRIYFDGEPVPHVECPVGDFFGVMHGLLSYPINTNELSVKSESGLNCYFPMPFAGSARIEFESGSEACPVYLMVDWHRYPNQELEEKKRFCARWRREFPTESYSDDFLMLDADGPGFLAGFVLGLRLIDDTDRWSHGGADNMYIDGLCEHPVLLRGIGGEDTFGASYGGAIHQPETHLHAAMPYYAHLDVGRARPAQSLTGYRFFHHDTIPFGESIHLRFGSMSNDICATTYWYSEAQVRPFFVLPPWEQLALLPSHFSERDPARELPKGSYDLPLPDSGSWYLCGPFENSDAQAMFNELDPERNFDPRVDYDGLHRNGSPWLSEGSTALGRHRARWVIRNAIHGFIDFNHVFRPAERGVAPTYPAVALARAFIRAPSDMTARFQIAWDDHLLMRVNDSEPRDMGNHSAFREESLEIPVRAGNNVVLLKLSNTWGLNRGAWAFAFKATTANGSLLKPSAQ